MEETFYVCLNNDCPKHRGVFVEGDPGHANCERERLYLEGQRASRVAWTGIALAATAVMGAVGAAIFLQQSSRRREDD